MTKVQPRNVDRFVDTPPQGTKAVLIYGPDGGAVRALSNRLRNAVTGNDDLHVTMIAGSAPGLTTATLVDELNAISMFGGRKAVLLTDAIDKNGKAVSGAVEGLVSNSVLIVTAAELGPRSALRKLFESRDDCAAIACYAPTAAEAADAVRDIMRRRDIVADDDAIAFLAERSGDDRGVLAQEAEKLALYVGEGGRVKLRDAVLCSPDAAAFGLDAIAFAAGDAKPAIASAALEKLLSEGVAPIAILRALARHYDRLQQVVVNAADGASLDHAISSLRPPVFFKLKSAFVSQAKRYSDRDGRLRIAGILERLRRVEAESKRSGARADALLRHAVLEIASPN